MWGIEGRIVPAVNRLHVSKGRRDEHLVGRQSLGEGDVSLLHGTPLQDHFRG
jgi:hypothetical protein